MMGQVHNFWLEKWGASKWTPETSRTQCGGTPSAPPPCGQRLWCRPGKSCSTWGSAPPGCSAWDAGMLRAHYTTQRHVGKLVEPEVTHCEGCVLLRFRGHLNLPEARLEIHWREICRPRYAFQGLLDVDKNGHRIGEPQPRYTQSTGCSAQRHTYIREL